MGGTPAGSEASLTCPLCPQKPATADPLPNLFCGPLRVSDCGSAWSEVWAAIPASDPLELVLHPQGGSQVCPLPAAHTGPALLLEPRAPSPWRPEGGAGPLG